MKLKMGDTRKGGQDVTPGTAAEWQMASGIERGREEFQIIISAHRINRITQSAPYCFASVHRHRSIRK